MPRRRFSEDPDPGETLHDVASDILHALGKGFLIASAGVLLGAVIGTNHLAAFGLWTVGVAAAMGVGSVIGAAILRNAGCGRRESEPEITRRLMDGRSPEILTAVEFEAGRRDPGPDLRADYVARLRHEQEARMAGTRESAVFRRW